MAEESKTNNEVATASEPVPVTQLNPAALMQGFSTMLSLRGNANG